MSYNKISISLYPGPADRLLSLTAAPPTRWLVVAATKFIILVITGVGTTGK